LRSITFNSSDFSLNGPVVLLYLIDNQYFYYLTFDRKTTQKIISVCACMRACVRACVRARARARAILFQQTLNNSIYLRAPRDRAQASGLYLLLI